MCIPFHTLPTRLTKAVSIKFKKNKMPNGMCIPFLPFHTAYKSRFTNNSKKKCPNEMCIPFRTSHTAYKSRFTNNWKKKVKQVCSVSPFWKCTPKGLFWGCNGAGVCVLGVLLGVQRQGLGVQGYGVKNTQ